MTFTPERAQAQFPANVKELLEKSNEKLKYPSGLVIDISVKMSMLLFSGNGTMKWYMKGDKDFMMMTMKAMGQEETEESGFDGQQAWAYMKATYKGEKDSLIITKTNVIRNNNFGLNIDYEKSYKTAKMKEKGRNYEIDFSNRIDPEHPKKMTIKIEKSNYYLREISTSVGVAKVTLTVTKVTKGCSDN